MWDSKNVVRDQEVLQVMYKFTVPLVDHSEDEPAASSIKSDISEPAVEHVLKPWKIAALARRFFGPADGGTQREDAGGSFDHIVREIRSFNKNIAERIGFNLKGRCPSASGESVVEPEVCVTPSDQLWGTVSESSSFASTQWEGSRTDLRVG